jgi:hypothetical protein
MTGRTEVYTDPMCSWSLVAEPKTAAIEDECDEHLQMEHRDQGEVAPNSTRRALRNAFFFGDGSPTAVRRRGARLLDMLGLGRAG